MSNVKHIFDQEINFDNFYSLVDSHCSLATGTCVACGFWNRKPFTQISKMTETQIEFLKFYESINGKVPPERFNPIYKSVMPKKIKGHWYAMCIDCVKKGK